MTRKKRITVLTPVYNEELNIPICHETVKRIFEKQLPDYEREHLFCDNASTDRSVEILRGIAAQDPCVKVVVNSRNVGPFRSTFNGLRHTTGDGVVVMLAVDLQDPPELIPKFVRLWEKGHQIVYGIRKNRQESPLMRNVRHLYYRMVTKLADIHIPPDVGEFQLADRVVIDAILQNDDYYPYLRGMIANCGFSATGIPYTWRARKRGFSKNRLYHLIDQGINGLISFSNVPLRLCLFAGFLLATASVLFALFSLIVNLIFLGRLAPPGIPTLIVAIFFFSGVQLFLFGVLGEYIGAIHSQVRKRPMVIERERINIPNAKP